ncbi:secretion activator protein [Phyllobacteriaceae bacterium JZ32]
MAKENFKRSLSETLSHEGEWADNPKDPGGATMKGVTLATFRSFYPGATKAQLKAITDTQLQRIYKSGYWDKVEGDRLAAGVDLATFDYAVNSGPAAAWKSLTAVLGGKDHETVKRLCARRLSIYQTFKHWKTFGKGWTRRIAAIEAKGVAWALAAQHEVGDVRQALEDEQTKAAATAKKQQGGAAATGGAAGGSAALSPEQADQLAGWILGGLLVAGILVIGYLVIRSIVNKRRAEAYRREAATI